MRIIALRTLRKYWEHQTQAEQPLKAWYKIASAADWATPDDVKKDYKKASFLRGNRICFNIGGNKFRLIVHINYSCRIMYILFIGAHQEYDAIDANAV